MTTATKTEPTFISESENPIFTGTKETRDIVQRHLIALSGTKKLYDQAKENLVKIVASNLLEKIKSNTGKTVLGLKGYRNDSGTSKRSVLEELVDRSLSLSIEKDMVGSDVCLIKKADLKPLGVSLPDGMKRLINEMNDDWGGSPKINWGFCHRDEDGKDENQLCIWIGFTLGTSVI